ncbi:AMP-binding enzyme [Hirsutella rhossiliensis]|uniref:AMP-binding enzyme domain-containing protein n=1 Tax=Hirsutella rhossiliensis TaxID=111463 RepID=A0A9P8N2R8_9HYPO|nr:AMP-binding enzyme domain-containing protein [Hirsutella rhossiliensis]KAH0964886.1 AMP-binding enzyme domain-containing protein [Hirsutella rhossiliensis]
MPFASEHPPLVVPETDILSYLFARGPRTDKPLWIDSRRPSESISARQALEWVRRLGFGLERLGLRRGDVVAICTPNHIWVPVAFLGIAGAGFVFSGASPAFTVRELAYQLANSMAKAILVHPTVLEPALEAAAQVGLPKDRIFQFSDKACQTRHGVDDWTAMIGTRQQGDGWQWPTLGTGEAARALAAINYSSGTTGLPKGVCISHANLITNLEQTIFVNYGGTRSSGPRLEERWIGFLPLFHAYGQLFMILMAAKLGVPVYVMAQFALTDFLAVIERHRITSLHTVPPVLVMLAKRPETSHYDLSSIRDVVCGAAPLSRELQNECQVRLGCQIRQAWGMTEATCTCAMTPVGFRDQSGSVGKLVPNCEAKLVDDDGHEAEAGQRGEMFIRGPNVCLGYWRSEQATRDTIDSQGWLRTGDIAIRNDDGLVYIVDRKKDFIKVNALQVAPAELEAALLENEHVADAAVVGITLAEGNERPRAYVVIQVASRSTVTPDSIRTWIASRVSKHKRLEGGVVFVDEIPKLPSGKIKRRMLRERARRETMELQGHKESGGDGVRLKPSL